LYPRALRHRPEQLDLRGDHGDMIATSDGRREISFEERIRAPMVGRDVHARPQTITCASPQHPP